MVWAIERLGGVEVALTVQHRRQIVQVAHVLRMVVAMIAHVDLDGLAEQSLGGDEVATVVREARQVVQRHGDHS